MAASGSGGVVRSAEEAGLPDADDQRVAGYAEASIEQLICEMTGAYDRLKTDVTELFSPGTFAN